MRIRLADPAPADAQRHLTFAWVKAPYGDRGQYTVKAWRGKAQKPFVYGLHRNEAAADAWIEQQKQLEAQSVNIKATRKAEKAVNAEKMREQLVVGTLLHYSWGYDQTNCEFYQIISRQGAKAVIREIAGETVPGSEGFMSCSLTPCPNKFIGEPITKIIGAYGIKMDFGVASPCAVGSKHSSTWYA
jgi:hypothetical protein